MVQPLGAGIRRGEERRGEERRGEGREEERDIDPTYVDALVNRGAIYSMQGSTEKALADLDQAVELQPNHALAHCNRGYAHFARRDYEQAITDYTRHRGRCQHELGLQ